MEHMIPDVPLITVPVPIYLPSPTASYCLFRPRAVPMPVPVFVPIMIPVTRKLFKTIRDYLQVIVCIVRSCCCVMFDIDQDAT
jgi:hypothetical protein